MALAFLCRRVLTCYPAVRVADNPVSRFYGIIVDHALREGSDEEAQKVAKLVREKIGITAEVSRITWRNDSGDMIDPNQLPNFETAARQRRYDRIASACVGGGAVSFFTAHNEDDQYETVLMRLLSGHGYRGLQGMRAATDIPECYTRHGVYQSGFVDDQRRISPYYNMRPTWRQIRNTRRDLRDRLDARILAEEMIKGNSTDPAGLYLDEYGGIATGSRRAPMLTPMEIEDGGVMLYRPLLNFSKDRLIATCLENKIPWFEDKTNHDPTFTLRNAVRHMCKNHNLPVALQKPAILQFSQRCRDKVALQEAETDRLFERTNIHDFEANVGTAVVEMPKISLPTAPRRSLTCPVRRQKRTAHYRMIAALLIRRLLSLVTPEQELSPIKNLDYLVSLLFPSLAAKDPTSSHLPSPPKPYVICGVHFTPLVGDYSLRWLLSRAPYPSTAPRPLITTSSLYMKLRYGMNQENWKYRGWHGWLLYDGRFWIRIRHRLPAGIYIAPFEPEHQKSFREGLESREAKALLSLTLKRYAPGKVRYTLPAIYAVGKVDDVLAGRDYWQRYSYLWQSRKGGEIRHEEEKEADEKEVTRKNRESSAPPLRKWQRIELIEQEEQKQAKPQLLALPTLGFYLPGVEKWIECEIRYKKVDIGMVNQSHRFWYARRRLGGLEGIRHRGREVRPPRPFVLFRSYRGMGRPRWMDRLRSSRGVLGKGNRVSVK